MATKPAAERPRTKKGTFRPDADTAIKDARVIELWAAGWTQAQIKVEMGWKHESSVSRSIDRGYRAIVAPNVDAARKRSVDRLDRAHNVAREILDKKHILVSQGRVMMDPDTGEVLTDDAPRLSAVDRIVKIEARLSALLGLDAPSKASVEVITRDVIVDRMEALTREMEQNDADEDVEV